MLLSASRILGRVFGLGIAIFAFWFSLVSHLFGSIPADGGTIIASIIATVLLHELLHAAAAFSLGVRRLSIGVWKKRLFPLGFYVSLSDELPLTRWLVVALSPLLFSPVCLLLGWTIDHSRGLFTWMSLVNAVGSAGDVALAILATGAGRDARVRDLGEAIEVVGGTPSRYSWALLNASATLGFTFLCSFVIMQLFLVAAATTNLTSIEFLGVKLVELIREDNRVAARTTFVYSAVFLVAGSIAAAAVAFRSIRERQSTYMSKPLITRESRPKPLDVDRL